MIVKRGPTALVQCLVCLRFVYQRDIIHHHWQPQYKEGKNCHIIEMCNTCHQFIHKIIPIENINEYTTPESFQKNPEFQKYLKFISTINHPHNIPLKKLMKKLYGL